MSEVKKLNQAAQMSAGCISKTGYPTQLDAECKGYKTYFCVYCQKWHRASLKKAENKHGIAVLKNTKPKAAKVKPPSQSAAEFQKGLEAIISERNERLKELRMANHFLRLEVESLKKQLIKLARRQVTP